MFFDELNECEAGILRSAIQKFEEIEQTAQWRIYGLGIASPFLEWFETLVDDQSQSASLQYRMFQLRSLIFHSATGGRSSRDELSFNELKMLACMDAFSET